MKTIAAIISGFLLFSSVLATAQDAERVKKTTEELSSPAYYGRSITKEGDRKAAQWIADQYGTMGLKQWNNSYFQDYTVSGNTFPGKVEVKIGGKTLQPGADYYLRLSSPDTTASFEIVKYYGAFLTTEQGEKILQTEMKDKALVVDMDYLMGLTKPDTMLKKVFKKQAGAYIFLSEKTVRFYNIYGNKVNPYPAIDMPRSAFDEKATRLDVSVEAEYKKDYTTRNVIGYIEGKSKPDEYVVVCGHYDHLGMMGSGLMFPGADDNASAIGVMLELARYYTAHQPSRTLVFASFSSEETGLQGAEWFVNHLPFDSSKINTVINFDMLAFGKDSFVVFNGKENPAAMEQLNQTCRQLKLPFVYTARENIPMSDHYAFTEKGIPALFITSGADRSPDYHTYKDDYKSAPFYNIRELMLSIIEYIRQLS